MSWYTVILNILELSAFIAGLVYWRKIRNSYWRWFPVYLGLIFVTEIVAEYFSLSKSGVAINMDIYRFFGIPLQFLFFFWLFYQYFRSTATRKWPPIMAAVYVGALILDLLYVGKMELYLDSFSYTIGCILLLVLLMMFFLRFSNSDEILGYRSSMMFWVCLGVMIFYVGSLPFYALRTTLYAQFPAVFIGYWILQYVFNYIMYGLFILSFIWGRPR